MNPSPELIAFGILAFIALVSAVMVVAARNPVRSVLYLILAFFATAGLFVLIGAEFLAMLLVVVYVGAVAVLFLFVVMMLDVDFVELRQGFLEYAPLGGLIGAILMIELGVVGWSWSASREATALRASPTPEGVTNAEAIGQVLYTNYVYLFQAAALVLLVAMIGAIVLTLRHKPHVKRQNIAAQVGRKREEGVELVDIKPGRGI